MLQIQSFITLYSNVRNFSYSWFRPLYMEVVLRTFLWTDFKLTTIRYNNTQLFVCSYRAYRLNNVYYTNLCGPGSVVDIATGYGLDCPGIESQWGRDFPHLSRPALGPSCTMNTGSFPGVKSGRGVTLTSHPLLVPWSWKSRAIPLLPLWAVRPVQSLSTCTRVRFTFTLTPSVASVSSTVA